MSRIPLIIILFQARMHLAWLSLYMSDHVRPPHKLLNKRIFMALNLSLIFFSIASVSPKPCGICYTVNSIILYLLVLPYCLLQIYYLMSINFAWHPYNGCWLVLLEWRKVFPSVFLIVEFWWFPLILLMSFVHLTRFLVGSFQNCELSFH